MTLKNTNKKTFLKTLSGAKTILSIFFMGSSVFASGFSLPTETFSQPQVQQVEKKDLSEFVSKLSERLQGVFGELLHLGSSVVNGEKLDTNQVVFASTGTVEQTGGLLDIVGHTYQSDIEKLVKYGIVDGQRPKFYPDNFLRKYEMIMMVVKYSLYQQDQQIPQIVFSSRGWFADVAQNLSYAPYIAYADQQGWLEGLIQTKDQTKYFYPNKFLVKQTVCDFLQVACDDLENIESDITRAEFAHLLVGNKDIVTTVSSESINNTNSTLLKTLGKMFAVAK